MLSVLGVNSLVASQTNARYLQQPYLKDPVCACYIKCWVGFGLRFGVSFAW